MRKIERIKENPIDDILICIADALCPIFYETGHTANLITLYSALSGAVAVYGMYNYDVSTFLVAWTVSYFFDCMDGHFARKYDMVSQLGDLLDHVKDILLWLSVFIILFKKFTVPFSYLVWFAVVAIVCAKHIGCQQVHYRLNGGNDTERETLDVFFTLCTNPLDIKWTRFFGAGSVNITLMIIVYLLIRDRKFGY